MPGGLARRLFSPARIHSCVKRQLRSLRATRERCSPDVYSYPKLSPMQVTELLRMGEQSTHIGHEALLKYESNKLAANNPIEDRHAEARCELTDGHLFGVFDGHAGVACAQAVSERLFGYIAVNLLSPQLLEEYLRLAKSGTGAADLVRFYRQSGDTYVNSELASTYANSLLKFAQESMSSIYDWEESFTMKHALIKGFERLDADMGFEALPPGGGIDRELLNVALSGSCAVVAHVDGPHLHVSSTGDCRAVLGSISENGVWTATQLSFPHVVDNAKEVTRIIKEHPNEQTTALAGGRLLGQLEPLRAFGDYRYKWSEKVLRYVASKVQSGATGHGGGARSSGGIPLWYYSPPPHYFTPPYLTAVPEVSYHYLTPRDKFLVLASDGLWDALPSDARVVQLVGDHMEGQQTVEEFKMPRRQDVTLGELSDMLTLRRQGIRKRAEDANAATHLIRNALGSSSSAPAPQGGAGHTLVTSGGATGSGVVHAKLSFMLSLPQPYVRMYRDDITITVIYFNSDYLRTCPAA